MKTYGLRDWANYATPFSDGSLDVYVSDIGQVPPLGPEEESSCIEHVRADGFSAEPYVKRLVEAHLGLVVSMAERHENERINIVDLIQRGNVGLFRALEALRSSQDERFSDYARPYIEAALAEAVRNSEPSGI